MPLPASHGQDPPRLPESGVRTPRPRVQTPGARHLVEGVWRHAEILDLFPGLLTNRHGAAICNPQLGPVGEFLRERLRPLEIATQIGIGARARAAAAGRLVDPEDYPAVVLKAGQEVFSRA